MAVPKRQSMQQELARFMLGVGDGERIPPVAALSQQLGVGTGTVQSALQALADSGALTLTPRGHLGTTVSDRHLPTLWRMSGSGSLECSMPLPISLEMSSIATAFQAAAGALGVEARLSFFQGVRRRLEEMRRGRADAVVGSCAALETLAGEHDHIESLGAFSFYARDSVVIVTRRGDDVKRTGRIPIDRHSFDHSFLTETEFPDAELVDASYPLIPEMVVNGDCDAAIWHQSSASPLLVATGISIHPLARLTSADLEPLSQAAVLTTDGTRGAAALVHEIVNHSEFDVTRRAVLNRQAVPEY